jgi:hypothetical protein
VSESIERKYHPLRRILDAYGVVLKRPSEDKAFEANGAVDREKILPFPLRMNRDYLQAAS